MMTRGKVIFVGAGPGDVELITVKGMKAIQQADVIFYDSLVDRSLLDGVKAQLMYVGKRRGMHSTVQDEINRLLANQAHKGKLVVRLKGGDCSVLGRLGEELLHLTEENIPFEIIPGVTSATAAPVFAGIPVTHRGMADSFAVVTAHRQSDELEVSAPPYNPSTTLVLLMALSTTPVWQKRLLELGYPTDLPVAYISSGGTSKQKVLVTTLGEATQAVEAAQLPTPALAVAGQVVTLRETLRWFDLDEEAASQNMEAGGEV